MINTGLLVTNLNFQNFKHGTLGRLLSSYYSNSGLHRLRHLYKPHIIMAATWPAKWDLALRVLICLATGLSGPVRREQTRNAGDFESAGPTGTWFPRAPWCRGLPIGPNPHRLSFHKKVVQRLQSWHSSAEDVEEELGGGPSIKSPCLPSEIFPGGKRLRLRGFNSGGNTGTANGQLRQYIITGWTLTRYPGQEVCRWWIFSSHRAWGSTWYWLEGGLGRSRGRQSRLFSQYKASKL